MAQEYFKLGGVKVRQPDTFKPSFATTSTSDSGRNQYLTMVQIPIGTISSYEVGWNYLSPSELSAILQQVIDKSSFTAHYCDAYTGTWKDEAFYASNYDLDTLTLKNGKEKWKGFGFSMVRITKL